MSATALPQVTNFCRIRRDTFPFTTTLKDSDGTVLDVTGFTFKLGVDIDPDPVDETNQVFEMAGVVTDGPNGVVEWSLSLADASIAEEIYFYEIQQTDGSSKTRTVLKGSWQVIEDVVD